MAQDHTDVGKWDVALDEPGGAGGRSADHIIQGSRIIRSRQAEPGGIMWTGITPRSSGTDTRIFSFRQSNKTPGPDSHAAPSTRCTS
jgi:hypothetical protein